MVRDGVDRRRAGRARWWWATSCAWRPGDQVVADGTVVSADGLALDESNLTGESEPVVRGAGRAGVVGLVRGRGRGALRGDGGRSGQPRRAADRDRARVPSPALSARAGQRPAAAVAGRALGPARDRAHGLGLRPRPTPRPTRVQVLTAGDRQPRPRGADPAHQPHRGGVGVQDRPARRARAAAQRGRVARLGRPRLHRQDRHADRADAAGGRARARRRAWTRRRSPRALAELRRQRAVAQPDARRRSRTPGWPTSSTRRVVGQVPFSSRRRWSALDLGDERLVLGAPERFAAGDPALAERARDGGGRGATSARARPHARRRCRPTDSEPQFPDDVQPLGLVVLAERLRPNAAETVAFFADQEVELKVLSGDAPATVGRDRARRRRARLGAGARRRGAAVRPGGAARGGPVRARRRADLARRASARSWTRSPTPVATSRWSATASTTSPRSRRRVSRSRRARGRRWRARSPTSCSSATTSRVVPGMVAEGRQILRNIQRVARLFVTKSVFTAVVGLAVAIPTGDLPAAPAPVHDRLHGHDRHPRLRARARAELRPVAAGAVPAVGRALRDPGRTGDRDRDHRRLPRSRATDSTSA